MEQEIVLRGLGKSSMDAAIGAAFDPHTFPITLPKRPFHLPCTIAGNASKDTVNRLAL